MDEREIMRRASGETMTDKEVDAMAARQLRFRRRQTLEEDVRQVTGETSWLASYEHRRLMETDITEMERRWAYAKAVFRAAGRAALAGGPAS